jgi:tRNA dimethylallyltransferase
MNRARGVLVIAGPTASGKSAVAARIAQQADGVVINADAMQVYRGLAALTAQPELLAASPPHRLYGFLDPADACSSARWAELAAEALKAAPGLPILVGGSGLYLRALMQGFAPIPAVSGEVRAAMTLRRQEIGALAFHGELATVDPISAARLHPTDAQRCLRAREVYEGTGRTLSSWQSEARAPYGGFEWHVIRLDPPREALYRRIDARLPELVDAGALREVAALIDLDPALPAARALGFAQFRDHLNGLVDLEQAISHAAQATRQYAKRQTTWFRHQLAAAMIVDTQECDSIADRIFAFIRERRLTPRI